MPARSLARRATPFVVAAFLPVTLPAQVIQIKTLPIADGDQFRIFPSANVGMAGLSIALPDSLLDPFVNPAKGAASLHGTSRAFFAGAPSFYSLSKRAGGGQTLPLAALARRGDTFGGVLVAVQQLDRAEQPQVFQGPILLDNGTTVTVGSDRPSRQNHYAFATLGRELPARGLAFAASATVSRLRDVDGTDLLYAGSSDLQQHGSTLDLRFGVTKRLAHGATFEALALHDRYDVRHDVTWADQFWDPNQRTFAMRARIDHNVDATNTWGLQLGYMRPLADSAWRVGAVATTNVASHPHLPDYRIEQVRVIPWDPGRSAAYDLGVGIARVTGPTTFGVDAIFEPITSHTWGESPTELTTASGALRPAGSKTTENWFRFSNAILRAGIGQDLPIDTTRMRVRLQLGAALRSIGYGLRQRDHVAESSRRAKESWTEWTRTWGLSMHVTGMELRYVGLHQTGTGRPGIVDTSNPVFAAAELSSSRNILSAPNGPLTLTSVATTTHQISVSMPLR